MSYVAPTLSATPKTDKMEFRFTYFPVSITSLELDTNTKTTRMIINTADSTKQGEKIGSNALLGGNASVQHSRLGMETAQVIFGEIESHVLADIVAILCPATGPVICAAIPRNTQLADGC